MSGTALPWSLTNNLTMQKHSLIRILGEMSKIDNLLDEVELAYIFQVGAFLGFTEGEVRALMASGSSGHIPVPSSEKDRMTVLYHLLFLMKVDKNISDAEKALVHHYGLKLGFSALMIQDFLNLIEHHAHKRVPEEAMLEIIKKYLN